MRCPYCGQDRDRVIDSRGAEDGSAIRRRRECEACGKRFTTYERVERTERLFVIKRDGSRVPFDSERIMRGVLAACGKRPIPTETKEELAKSIEDDLHREFEREVESKEIGRRVASRLRELDPIAYIRFASEHYDFRTLEDLEQELDALRQRPKNLPNQTDLFPRE
ncbi:MAG: transcriptional repressor NrdR [Phycisphaerae bacterium]|jgi:transcriptional repressor NrdR|nr:transcriptional repressor NrdR [Phycisphaerae bacterium]